jgi:hypothetical protein
MAHEYMVDNLQGGHLEIVRWSSVRVMTQQVDQIMP